MSAMRRQTKAPLVGGSKMGQPVGGRGPTGSPPLPIRSGLPGQGHVGSGRGKHRNCVPSLVRNSSSSQEGTATWDPFASCSSSSSDLKVNFESAAPAVAVSASTATRTTYMANNAGGFLQIGGARGDLFTHSCIV